MCQKLNSTQLNSTQLNSTQLNHNLRLKSGFTLVELSIVLVIIGLIVGGVLVGKDLVRAAELRNVVSEVEKIKTAVHTFKGKYNGLPGDMADATTYWGAANANATTCTTTNTLGSMATCNGNGNGKIGDNYPINNYESFRFWQQLNNAGLWAANVTGVTYGGMPHHSVVGINVPPSKFANAGYNMAWIQYTFDPSINGYFFHNYNNNVIYFGATVGLLDNDDGNAYAKVLTPADAMWIDTKMDDGVPGTGQVSPGSMLLARATASGITNPSLLTFVPNCATTQDPTTAIYNMANTTAECDLMFMMNF